MDESTPFILDWHNGLGLALSVLVAFISGPGGQGGGSFYIPLFSVLLGFSVNQAAALSSAVVFFGCITMVVQAMATQHPETPTLPVIDYTLVVALTPALCLGLCLGVLVNALISQWLLNIFVVLIWSWSCLQLSFTYRGARIKERQQTDKSLPKLKEQQSGQMQNTPCNLRNGLAHSLNREALNVGIDTCTHQQAAGKSADKSKVQIGAQPVSDTPLEEILVVPCQQTMHLSLVNQIQQPAKSGIHNRLRCWVACQPWKLLGAIAVFFSFFIVMQTVRGAVTPECSTGYWITIGVLSGVSMLAGLAVCFWLLSCTARLRNAAPSLPDVNAASSQNADICAAAASGVINQGASHTGIYGSIVEYTHMRLFKLNLQMLIAGLMLAAWPLSPIIMALPGMHPQVAAGTSKLMLFLITGGSALSFIAGSNINTTYMLAYGITNALATPLGVWVVDKIIKRTGRPSVLLMLTILRLAVCVVIQVAFAAVPQLIALAHGLPRAGFMPKPICHH